MAANLFRRSCINAISRTRYLRPVAASSLTRLYSASEKVTHTGQVFDDDDFRRARFIDREKLVNENFGEKLIAEEAPIEVDGRIACCNGGGGALGHPKVYINLDRPGPHPCGYCGLRFIRKSH